MPRSKPAPPTVVIDTREQAPWSFTLPTVRATVPTGADYTVQGFDAAIGVERKSLPDLVQSLTGGRERFDRSLAALRTRTWRALIVEGTYEQIASGHYMSKATPTSIIGSIAAIMADGVPVFLAGDPKHAAAFAERLLLKF